MKLKNLLGGVALVALALSFTSCKKDWVCVCSDGGISIDSDPIKNVTKSEAKEKCSDLQGQIRIVFPKAECSVD